MPLHNRREIVPDPKRDLGGKFTTQSDGRIQRQHPPGFAPHAFETHRLVNSADAGVALTRERQKVAASRFEKSEARARIRDLRRARLRGR